MNQHTKREISPAVLLSPVPVTIVTCKGKKEDTVNALAVAWTGTICSKPPMVSISLRPERYSYHLIEETGEFVINIVNKELIKACDYCGVRSGAKENKLEKLNLTTLPLRSLSYAEALKESPLSLACKVVSIEKRGSHSVFSAEIVQVIADEIYFDENEKLCLEKANLVCYTHGDYYELGNRIGFYGFSVASKDIYKKRMKKLVDVKKMPSKENAGSPKKRKRKKPL